MREGLLGRDAAVGVQGQALLEEVRERRDLALVAAAAREGLCKRLGADLGRLDHPADLQRQSNSGKGAWTCREARGRGGEGRGSARARVNKVTKHQQSKSMWPHRQLPEPTGRPEPSQGKEREAQEEAILRSAFRTHRHLGDRVLLQQAEVVQRLAFKVVPGESTLRGGRGAEQAGASAAMQCTSQQETRGRTEGGLLRPWGGDSDTGPDLAKHLLREGALVVHHQLEHLVVGAPREQDLAGDELVEDATDAPHVERVAC